MPVEHVPLVHGAQVTSTIAEGHRGAFGSSVVIQRPGESGEAAYRYTWVRRRRRLWPEEGGSWKEDEDRGGPTHCATSRTYRARSLALTDS